MIFEGEHSVIQAIKEKKRLMEAGEPYDHIRPLLIQGGGLMRGVYGAGAAMALEEMGHTNSFTDMVGISSGAPITAHFAAGTIKSGLDIYTEVCCTKNFVNLWRFWNQVDTKHLMEIIKNDESKRVDFNKVKNNPTKVYFGVAEYKTALPKMLSYDDEDKFFASMHASLNMQNVSPHKIIIDDIHYADGGFSKPHAVTEIMRVIDPTHMLIITNNDRCFTPISWIEKALNRTLFRFRLNGALAHAINSRREARDLAIAGALNSDIETAVVWGDGSVGGMEKNPDKIAAAMEASRTWWHGLFALENK